MSENPYRSDVFKFVSLRPPVSVPPLKRKSYFITDERAPVDTPIGKIISTFQFKEPKEVILKAKEFIKSENDKLITSQNKILLIFSNIEELLLHEDTEQEELILSIERVLGSPIYSFLTANQGLNAKIWDLYYAYLLTKADHDEFQNLVTRLQIFHFLKRLTATLPIKRDEIRQVLSAKPLIDNFFTAILRPVRKLQTKNVNAPADSKDNKYGDLWNQLADTHNALSDILSVKVDIMAATDVKDLVSPDERNPAEAGKRLTSVKNWLTISKKSLDELPESSSQIIGRIIGDRERLQIPDIIAQLKTQFDKLYLTASSIKDPRFFNQIPEKASLIPGLSGILNGYSGSLPPTPFPAATNIRKLIRPLGIGDLKVVKQTLRKYTTKEISHIENVLRGEYKERTHRALDRTEDIYMVSNETEEETTKDTQTTERFELQKESEKTLQEKMSVEAGVTVSGSYGMVTFGAHGDFAYSTSNEESNKSSSNFAREVIDKSVFKIQKKTKEERTSKNLHEVEEINKHGIDNKDKTDHAVGIYLWVNKHYEAQIYNYGKRMMFEFIIPEPAAFYQYAQSHSSKTNIQAPKPLDPGFTYKNIESWNVDTYIRDYNVQGIVPAPPLYKTISTAIVKDGMPLGGDRVQSSESASFVMNSKELIVPANYIARVGVWWDLSAVWTHYPKIEVTIGNKIFRPLNVEDPKNNNFNERFLVPNQYQSTEPFHTFFPESIIQVSVNSYDVLSYTLNVYAFVERTQECYQLWQIQCFEKIMTAYKAMQAEYEQKMAAQETLKSIGVQGQNPEINREVEKNELKKQCIKYLMDTAQFGTFDAMKDEANNSPDFDVFDALNEGKTIQFFEQAFEWENLTYLYYPYFWTGKDKWVEKSTLYGTDPLFTKFLQAGSSRVVIPVRPGYNDVVTFYIQSGVVWGEDGNPPLIHGEEGSVNSLFMGIADELRNQTDDLANAVPEGEPWEVILPTTLVYLQQSSDLPTFE